MLSPLQTAGKPCVGPGCRGMGLMLATRSTGVGLDGLWTGCRALGLGPFGVCCGRDGAPSTARSLTQSAIHLVPCWPPRDLRESPSGLEACRMLPCPQGMPRTVTLAGYVTRATPQGQ